MILKTIGLLAIVAVSTALFIASCIATSVKEQGEVAFFVFVPLATLLLGGGLLGARGLTWRPLKGLFVLILGAQAAFLATFLAGNFYAPLQPLTHRTLAFVDHAIKPAIEERLRH